MDKQEFTNILQNWLEEFAKKKFSNEYEIKVIIPNSNLNILQDVDLSKMVNVGLMEFKPDILGILTNKKTKQIELILLNREIKKFGLREIGEMLCYCRLTNPKLAIMASLKGLSPDIDKMINHQKRKEILEFNDNVIQLFRWDQHKTRIDKYSITPIESKEFFD
tara:strand:+ start:1743 stop:2234 length:492 start_codon:yes stop_codon:yes gene_type:complete